MLKLFGAYAGRETGRAMHAESAGAREYMYRN